jgi:hypothetical protein
MAVVLGGLSTENAKMTVFALKMQAASTSEMPVNFY